MLTTIKALLRARNRFDAATAREPVAREDCRHAPGRHQLSPKPCLRLLRQFHAAMA